MYIFIIYIHPMGEIIIQDCVGFDWDKGNLDKNRDKHSVTNRECEQIFFNHPQLLYEDIRHSSKEKRLYILGKTNNKRLLFTAFTIRNKLIRVISARNMSKKERKIYEKNTSL